MAVNNHTTTAETALHRNPFYVLRATTRDTNVRLIELEQEQALAANSEQCQKARADLLGPRTRLGAEMAWLPGVSPRRASQALQTLLDEGEAGAAAQFPPLAKANLLAASLELLEPTVDNAGAQIMELADATSGIDPDAVLRDLNEDRSIAGVPPVKNVELVESELATRRRYYRDVLRDLIDRLPTQDMLIVVAQVVDQDTNNGENHPSSLVDDLIEAYAVGAHNFLTKEAENIRLLIERVRKIGHGGDPAVSPTLDSLEQVLRNWHAVAKPIQTLAGAKGTKHDLSQQISFEVRALGISLYNEHNMLKSAQRISIALRDTFGAIPEIAERANDDVETLDTLEKKKPINELCMAALKQVENDPLSGAGEARKLLNAVQGLIAPMAREGVVTGTIHELEDAIALTIMRCLIAQGNMSKKWGQPIEFLEEAQKLAHDEDIVVQISTNLATARENQRIFGNLQPINSTPPLTTFNGFGFAIYGADDFDQATGSCMATYYFVVLFFPLFPISRYRVIRTGTGFRFLGKAPLRTFDKWHLAIAIVLAVAGILMASHS